MWMLLIGNLCVRAFVHSGNEVVKFVHSGKEVVKLIYSGHEMVKLIHSGNEVVNQTTVHKPVAMKLR